jgi:Clr5 domain
MEAGLLPSPICHSTSDQVKEMIRVPQIDDDWSPHRQEITRLYRDLNLPLKEVQKFMEEEHNFKAS